MKYIELKDINEYKSESINPAKMQETIFELYSVPVYETGHPEYLTGKEIASSKILVRKNDILLCKINPRINRVWIVRKESENINIASSEWIVIRNNKYNPEFLAWYFRSRKFRQLMVSEVTGIGGSLTRAQPKRVAKYPVPIMDRIVQDKIVYRLNRIQKIIDMKKKELTKLDSLIQARFVEMFGDPITNSKLLPIEKIEERYFLKAGITTKAEDIHDYLKDKYEIPCYGGNGIRGYVENLSYEGCYPIIGRQGALCGNVQYATGKFHATEHAVLVSTLKNDNTMWVYYMLKLMDLYRYHTGAAQPGLAVKKLNTIDVIVADINLQNQFAAFVHQINKSKFVIHKFLYCTTHNTKSIIKPRPNTKESGKIRGGKPHADEF